MTYNLHPLFVHFPIALLFIYSIIKILPMQRFLPRVAWKDVERILLVIGVLSAFIALSTGETAEHLVRPDHKLVETHSTFATISTWLYAALLIGEIASFLATKINNPIIVFLKKLLTNEWLSKIIAILALASIAITGLLGGIMVYGTSADPLAEMALKILGITL